MHDSGATSQQQDDGRPGEVGRGTGGSAFRAFLSAGLVSLVGDGVRVAALPLYTAVSTGSPLAVSAVAAAETLPWLLVAIPAGALVDRSRPRRVLVAAHLLRFAITGGLAAAALTHHAVVALLVAVAFALTSVETFADAANQSLLVDLAGTDDLGRANGWFVTADTVGVDLVGPLLAAATFLWQPALCFALDALSFLVAAVLLTRVPETFGERATEERGEQPRLRAQVAEGARFIVRSGPLRTLVAAVVFIALAASASNAVVSLFAVDTLRVGAALVPTIWVVQALGTLLAARVVGGLAGRFGEGRVMVAAMLLVGLAFAVLGLIPSPVALWPVFALVGLGVGAWNVLSATRRQRITPKAAMGRVTSSYRLLAWGLMPLGAAAAGPVAALTSLATVYLLIGAVVLAAGVVLARPLARDTGGAQPVT